MRLTTSTTFKFAACLAACLSLGACATMHTEDTAAVSASFGDAVRHNIAAQAITPSEAQKNNTYIPADRERQILARERYKTDEIKPPKAQSTR